MYQCGLDTELVFFFSIVLDHQFARKQDLKICMEEADRNGAALPITSIIDQFYKELQNSDGGRLDTSSLLKRLQEI